MKKVPLRTCIITKEKLEKKDLFRVVRTPEGNVTVDATGKQNGKGAYLKKDKDVILKAQKSKILDRTLEVTIPEAIYEELINLI